MLKITARIGAVLAAALLVIGVLIGVAKVGPALGFSSGGPRTRPAQAQLIDGSQTSAAGQPRGGGHEMSQSPSLGQVSEVGKSLVLVALAAGAVLVIGRIAGRTAPQRNEEHKEHKDPNTVAS